MIAEEMPRERMLAQGPDALSVSELIAILLGTGVRGKGVTDFAKDLLTQFGSMRALFEAPLQELMAVKGIGTAKAVQLKAAFSLALRLLQESRQRKKEIVTPRDAYEQLSTHFFFHDREEMVVLCRDTRGNCIALEPITKGVLNEVSYHPREVLREVLRHQAYSFVLAHNHPSGDPTPSQADKEVTFALVQAAHVVGIRLDDHLIVGDHSYYSFFESRNIPSRTRY
ncbi:MAG: DNA repair protein RadC [Candidatus Algichlamydia australiensis]|nr:DNA repair protein RadC [Chlamydiales bacterium]